MIGRSSSLPRPRPVPSPRPRPSSSRSALAVLLGGVVLAVAGLARLPGEFHRQITLAPLAAPGGWQRAFVEEGVKAPADRAEAAARRSGRPAALAAAAEVLAALSAASGDPELTADLRRRALDLARTALAVSPGLAQAHLLAGAALIDLDGEAGRADWHLARAAALDPHRASLRRALGLVEIQRRRPEAAAAHLRVALAARPQAGGELFDALASLDAPLSPADVTPPRPRAQVALGSWLDTHGDPVGARRAFETALTLADAAPDSAASSSVAAGEIATWAYRQLAGHLFRHGLLEEAEALAAGRMTAARFGTPAEEALLAHHRGTALERLGRPAAALPWLQRAWDLEPDRAAYADALARALAREENHVQAAAVWRDALALPRTGAGAARLETAMRLGRAASLAAAGERQEALREVGRVLMTNPLNERARVLAAKLAYD